MNIVHYSMHIVTFTEHNMDNIELSWKYTVVETVSVITSVAYNITRYRNTKTCSSLLSEHIKDLLRIPSYRDNEGQGRQC